MRANALVLGLLGFVVSTALGANQVLVVDPTGATPGSYTTLETAVDAAGDGDLVWIQQMIGSFGFTVSGKSLTIVAPDGTPMTIRRSRVENLQPNQRVTLRNLTFGDGGLAFPGGLEIVDNAGSVVLDHVTMYSDPSGGAENNEPMLRIANSDRVVLVECDIEGVFGQTPDYPYPPKTAVYSEQSDVMVYGGSIRGSFGRNAGAIPVFGVVNLSEAGGPGFILVDGSLALHGAEVRGGAGGAGLFFEGTCLTPSDGGVALVAGGAVRIADSTLTGGAAGSAGSTCPMTSSDGDDLQLLTGGSVSPSSQAARRTVLSAPLSANQTASFTVHGEPGDLIIPLVLTSVQPLWIPSLEGYLIGPLPAPSFILGALPASGEIAISPAIPSNVLPAGVDGVDLFVQSIVLDSAGNGWLTSPSATSLLR